MAIIAITRFIFLLSGKSKIQVQLSKIEIDETHLVQKSCEGFSLETAFNSAFTWREKNSSQQQNDEKLDHMGRLSDMT